MKTITPCLWFDSEAEEAAKFYCSVFPNSRIVSVSHYTKEGQEHHHKESGSVMAVAFELDGRSFSALNGGPLFKFSEAISLQIPCATQKDVDYYWSALTKDGEEGYCGWLKDKYGLSWQVVPTALLKMLEDPDRKRAERVTKAFMQMRKFDIAALNDVYRG